MTKEQKTLLELVNIGAGGECLFSSDVMDADWNEVFELAQVQGVVGISWHGLEVLYKNGVDKCPADVKLQWYGANKQRAIAVRDKKQRCIEFVEKLGVPCVVLKGLDYCRFWPKETLREFGDLDIWSDGKYDEINKRAAEIGCKVDDYGYYKHLSIYYKDLLVENHQYLSRFDGTKIGNMLENTLRELLVQNGSKLFNNVQGCDGMLSPCNEFTALFMLLHAHQHFFYEGLSLRQILDWKFFIEKEENNTNWADVVNVLKNAHIKEFYDVITEFCVKHLGLKTNLSYSTKKEMLQQFTDVIFAIHKGKSKIKRLVCRFRRMWRFRNFLGESIFIRIVNTYRFNFRHKMPVLD